MKKRWLMVASMVTALFLCNHTTVSAETIEVTVPKTTSSDCVYLSDMDYVKDKSFAEGNHTIHLDENDENKIITLITKKEENNTETKKFVKGLCAWATSEIVYELEDHDYDYFTAYLGVDISEQDSEFNTGVKFYIYTSANGTEWTEKYQSQEHRGWDVAEFAKVDVKGARYLKLVADDNSDNWWSAWYDEAVYADAKLIKEGYTEDTSDPLTLKTVAEYDALLKAYSGAEAVGTHEAVLLQREFVNNVGYDVLQSLARYKKEYKDTIEWLLNDTETLRLYLVAGQPEGSYMNSVKVLSELYTRYKDTDLKNDAVTAYGTTYKELYKKMILALSLTHSGNAYFWMDGKCHSDAVTRYELYKKLHLHEGQESELIENEIFESLTVEEMRWVMNTIIDDEEILWLNDWVRKEGQGKISPYNYITYTFGYDYTLDKYYSAENYDKWNQKYHLADYNITYEKGQQKLWHVFEEGSVCGGLSKTGSCIWGAYKGLPNTCISQPAHCAYIYYTWDADGNVKWEVGNNVSGWGQSGKTEHLNTRTMNDWGSGSYTTGWNANYILLAQAAQNEYDKYEAAEKIMMLAKVYQGDSQKLEEIYRNALEAERINFDAWLGLVELYNNDENRTEEQYYELASAIVETLTYYPYPMNDLLKLIEPHFTSVGYQTMFSMLQTRALTTASKATKAESIQYEAVQQVANQLLGNMDTSLANFSFDGEHAGKIILSDRYDGTDVAWQYSLDGASAENDNWILTEDHEVQLTAEQIASITAENDIKIHIMGVDYSESNIYTIDIKESTGLPSKLCMNDLENKLIGVEDTMEWKGQENEEWTSFAVAQPNLEGNTSVLVRNGATGVYLAEKTVTTFTFTEEPKVETQRYVSIDHVSVESVSSEQGGSDLAVNAIDGNINTIWHTKHDASDRDRTFVMKLDEPIYLSVFQYVPRQDAANGRAKACVLYVSMDGETWTEAGSASDWANDKEPKAIVLTEPVQAKYVKFVTTENYGTGIFASAAMLNLFEDVTKKTEPRAEVVYDVTAKTSGPVRAKLVNPSTEVQITNNDGSDTYTFTENGEFTFEFEDVNGNKGTAKAKVTWIVKTAGSGDNQNPGDDNQNPGGDNKDPGTDEGGSGDNTQKPGDDNKDPGTDEGGSGDNTQKPGDDNKDPGTDEGGSGNNTQKPGGDTQNPAGGGASGGNQTSSGSGSSSLSGNGNSSGAGIGGAVNKSQSMGAISSLYSPSQNNNASSNGSAADLEKKMGDADASKEQDKEKEEDESTDNKNSDAESSKKTTVTSTNGSGSGGLSDNAKKAIAALGGLTLIGGAAFLIYKKK